MQKPVTETSSGLFLLVNNLPALQAAERLAQSVDSGMRFCCENQQKLTLAQGRARDLHNAARKARFQTDDDAPAHDAIESATASAASLETDDDTDDLLDFERDTDDYDVEALFDQTDDDAISDAGDDLVNERDFELELA